MLFMRYFRKKYFIKTFAVCVLCILTAFPTTGCIHTYYTTKSKFNIVTTVFAAYDFARGVCGDTANVTLLIGPGKDVHSYEPTPQDIIAIKKCDLFIYTGGENDVWVENILESFDTSKIDILRMMDVVKLYEESDEGILVKENEDAAEEDEADEEAEWDEHVWTNPHNALLISQAIKKECDIIVDYGMNSIADEIRKRVQKSSNEYFAMLEVLDISFKSLLKDHRGETLVFADRFPLRYFTEAYGLKYIAAYPGCAAQSEPSAKTLAAMIDYVKSEQVPVVFKVEISNDNMQRTICEETGAKPLTFYSCHTVSLEDFNNGETYITLMQRNLEALKEAL